MDKQLVMNERKRVYCKKCNRWHKWSSKIAVKHGKYLLYRGKI